jgi:hypothetical protein
VALPRREALEADDAAALALGSSRPISSLGPCSAALAAVGDGRGEQGADSPFVDLLRTPEADAALPTERPVSPSTFACSAARRSTWNEMERFWLAKPISTAPPSSYPGMP